MSGNIDTNKEVQKKNSLALDTWKRLLKNKGAMFGLVFMVGLVLMAIFADVLYDYDTQVIAQNIPNRLIHPCREYPFGTDDFGRDLLARIVHGSRMSLVVSFTSVAISLTIGGVLGAISGYSSTGIRKRQSAPDSATTILKTMARRG